MHQPAEVLALLEVLCGTLGGPSAHRIAHLLDHVGADLTRLDVDHLAVPETEDLEWAKSGLARIDEARVSYWEAQIDRLYATGVRVIFTGTPDFPQNLALIPNHPPVIFVRGSIEPSDLRAIAVVGTRDASGVGREKAFRVASQLARRGITVVSGLAEGIDTVAHRAALDAGRRTIAVLGTGIDRVYPASNRGLADQIVGTGALVSQWWPGQAVTRWTLPLRNIVTSGLSLGTVVVEASETSGAKRQAEEARKHGRRLFLLEHLVTNQPWAAALVDQPGVHVVRHVEEIQERITIDLDTETFSLAS